MTVREAFTYITVAACCILLHNVVLVVGDAISLALWASVLISFALVSVTGYLLHCRFTFQQQSTLRRYAHYAWAMSVNAPLAYVTTWFWHEQVRLEMIIAAPLASACMLAANYLLGRWAIVTSTPLKRKVR